MVIKQLKVIIAVGTRPVNDCKYKIRITQISDRYFWMCLIKDRKSSAFGGAEQEDFARKEI